MHGVCAGPGAASKDLDLHGAGDTPERNAAVDTFRKEVSHWVFLVQAILDVSSLPAVNQGARSNGVALKSPPICGASNTEHRFCDGTRATP